MTLPEKHIDKPDLLHQIRQERQELEALLERIPRAQMTVPGVVSGEAGEWTVKDLLAHLTAWDLRLQRWLGQAIAGQTPPDLTGGITGEMIQSLNSQSYQEDRERPLDEVLARFGDAYRDTFAAVEALPEEALNDLERFPWRKGRPLWWLVAANTSWHYREHREAIEAWLSSLQDRKA